MKLIILAVCESHNIYLPQINTPVDFMLFTMKRWELWLIKFTLYNAFLVGYTSINIDFHKRQLKMRKSAKFVAAYGNISFLIYLPMAFFSNINSIVTEEKNLVIKYAYTLTTVSRLIFLLVTVLMRLQRDKLLTKWLEKVLMIQISYFDRFPNIPRDTRLRKFLYFNIFLTFYHTNDLFSRLWIFIINGDWWNFLNVYMVCGAISMQHIIMLHHGALLCYIYECYSIINNQIKNELFDPKLGIIHFHLTTLIAELNSIFNPINLWIQLTIFLSNSMVGYVSITNIISGNIDFDRYKSTLGNSLYYFLCIHMYVYFMLCEWVEQISAKTLYLLKSFSAKSRNQEVCWFFY